MQVKRERVDLQMHTRTLQPLHPRPVLTRGFPRCEHVLVCDELQLQVRTC